MQYSCALCGGELDNRQTEIRDFEYGVAWNSCLKECASCGLVTQVPPLSPKQLPSLYPSDYLAHTGKATSRGVYGRIKGILARLSVAKVTGHLPENGRFLEVGCGSGGFAQTLNSIRPDVVMDGVDIKDACVFTSTNFTFHLGQLEEVALPLNGFDLIYHSNLIEHVSDPEVFLRTCLKLLKPGGKMMGITPNHLSIDRYIFGKFWAGYHYPRHTFIFNHKNITKMLNKVGFEVESISGAYGYWYLSLANRFVEYPGRKKRGILFAAITALFLPLDILLNCFFPHGSMTFVARKPPNN